MKKGYLSQYFNAVAARRLTLVETDKKVSNQHEYNGTKVLKSILGTFDTNEKVYFSTRFIWMSEGNATIMADGTLTWYNSRVNKNRADEWRLFYPSNDVTNLASEGDLMIIAKRTDGTLLNIIAAAGSTVENQLLWLFDVPVQTGKDFVLQQFDENHDKELNVMVTFILEELGVIIEEVESEKLDFLVERFKGAFPKSREFSLYARATCEPVNAVEEPDRSLLVWMNHEEKLFRRLERQIVEKRMQEGFGGPENVDVDGFISFSLSVQNRRKSRAGLALENHLEQVFDLHGVSYSRVAVTENKSKPDFLFPDAAAYHNNKFPNELLTMLGVKTTCKDRWRQVLSEAAKISTKNLFTIEPGISENQTNEMKAHNLQLVLPKSIHESYSITQRSWLLDLSEFLAMTKERQNKAPISHSS